MEKLEVRNILHPLIVEHAFPQLQDGHLRSAVLDAFIAVFDLIRERTGLGLDGAELAARAFSLSDAMLIVSELDSESGRSDQKGFIQLLQGAYQSVRNPKAHTLRTDLTPESAAQYLVFASLLARRIQESRPGNILRFDGLYRATDHNDIGQKIVRFYEDGEVLAVSTEGTGATVAQIMSWFTKEGARVKDYPRGTFMRNGKQLRFSTTTKQGEVQYEGEIDGEQLNLNVHSLINKRRSQYKFIFERSSSSAGRTLLD